MVWFFLGLLLYCLVVLSEHALVGVTPQELESLRNTDAASAKRAVLLVQQIRPAMSALLLARLLLKLLLIVFGVAFLLVANLGLREMVQALQASTGLSANILMGGALAGFCVVAALIFRLAKQVDFLSGTPRRSAFWLQRLSTYIVFWKTIFFPFIKKEKIPMVASVESNTAAAMALDQTPHAGEKREIELLKSIVKFSDVTVKNVLQPRAKVAAVDFRTDFDSLLQAVRESGFSRLPVYDDDLDNVTGILYVKDLVPHLDKGADFEWQSLIRTSVMLVPEAKRASELLTEFKEQKMHMAIVVDEYGGSSGIVTLEDILEEVTGEIRDEFDEEQDVRYRKIDDRTYIFDGQTQLHDVCRIAGLPDHSFDNIRGSADTIAGLALELAGDIPKPGDEIKCPPHLMTVVSADNRRIKQIRITFHM